MTSHLCLHWSAICFGVAFGGGFLPIVLTRYTDLSIGNTPLLWLSLSALIIGVVTYVTTDRLIDLTTADWINGQLMKWWIAVVWIVGTAIVLTTLEHLAHRGLEAYAHHGAHMCNQAEGENPSNVMRNDRERPCDDKCGYRGPTHHSILESGGSSNQTHSGRSLIEPLIRTSRLSGKSQGGLPSIEEANLTSVDHFGFATKTASRSYSSFASAMSTSFDIASTSMASRSYSNSLSSISRVQAQNNTEIQANTDMVHEGMPDPDHVSCVPISVCQDQMCQYINESLHRSKSLPSRTLHNRPVCTEDHIILSDLGPQVARSTSVLVAPTEDHAHVYGIHFTETELCQSASALQLANPLCHVGPTLSTPFDGEPATGVHTHQSAFHRVVDYMSAAALYAAFSVHSILEGIGLAASLIAGSSGSNHTVQSALTLGTAIVAHKGLAAFAVGESIMRLRTNYLYAVLLMSIFASSTPLGIAVGMTMVGHSTLQTIMSNIATGSLLFVLCTELIPRLLSSTIKLKKAQPEHFPRFYLIIGCWAMVGFSLMALSERR